jgi:hypothetical protein
VFHARLVAPGRALTPPLPVVIGLGFDATAAAAAPAAAAHRLLLHIPDKDQGATYNASGTKH